MRRISETSVQTMLPLLVHTVSFQIITYAFVGPTLLSTPILYLRDVITLMTLCNARTAHAPAPQRLVRSWRHGSRRVSLSPLLFFLDVCATFGSVTADVPSFIENID